MKAPKTPTYAYHSVYSPNTRTPGNMRTSANRHSSVPPPRARNHARDNSVSASSLLVPVPPSSAASRRRSRSVLCQCLPLLVISTVLVILSPQLRARAGQLPSGLQNEEDQETVVLPTKKEELLAALSKGPDGEEEHAANFCQTIVFFHIPKTGSESIYGLWERRRRMFGWDRYRKLAMRNTEATVPDLPSMSIRDQSRLMETVRVVVGRC